MSRVFLLLKLKRIAAKNRKEHRREDAQHVSRKKKKKKALQQLRLLLIQGSTISFMPFPFIHQLGPA